MSGASRVCVVWLALAACYTSTPHEPAPVPPPAPRPVPAQPSVATDEEVDPPEDNKPIELPPESPGSGSAQTAAIGCQPDRFEPNNDSTATASKHIDLASRTSPIVVDGLTICPFLDRDVYEVRNDRRRTVAWKFVASPTRPVPLSSLYDAHDNNVAFLWPGCGTPTNCRAQLSANGELMMSGDVVLQPGVFYMSVKTASGDAINYRVELSW